VRVRSAARPAVTGTVQSPRAMTAAGIAPGILSGFGEAMKIYVNQIPEEGLTLRATYDPAALDMERPDVHLAEPFEAEAVATKADQELIVAVDVRVPARLTCARCLDEVSSVLTAQAVFNYNVEPTDVVDITDDVRQEVILSYPMVPVCRPECKGLCSVCGQNLNAGACVHQPA
jgi:uncharacterized protein